MALPFIDEHIQNSLVEGTHLDIPALLAGIPEDYTTKVKWSVDEAIAFVSNKFKQLPEDLFPPIDAFDETRGTNYELRMDIPYLVLIHSPEWDRPVFHWAHPLTVQMYTYYCAVVGEDLPAAVEWEHEDNRDYPQTNVAAIHGAAFANWLNEQLGFKPCYEVTSDNNIKKLHQGFAVQIPTNKVYEKMIDGIVDLADADLALIAVHKENSGGKMQKVRAIIQPYTNKHMLAVVTPDGRYYTDIPKGFGLIWGPVGNVYTIVAVEEAA